MRFVWIILIIFISASIKAQVINFERVHQQDTGWSLSGGDILELNDSGYVGIGFTVAFFPTDSINVVPYYPSYYHAIFRVDNQGDSVFIKNVDFGNQNFFNVHGYYPGNVFFSVAKISDNSFMATGWTQTVLPPQNTYDADCIFYKFDSNGDSIACSVISVIDTQINCTDIILTSDYYLISVGFEITTSGTYAKGIVVKTDTSGNIIWRKTYSTPFDMHITGITESPAGGFILAAQTFNGDYNNGNNYNPIMLKIDTSGTINWIKHFSTINYMFPNGPSVTATTDSNYIFSYPNYAQAPTHFKMNENGDTLWKRSIDIYQQEGYATQSTFSASDNYGGIVAIATVYDSTNFRQGAIYRLSGDGDLLWNRKFGTSFNSVRVYSVKQTSDNGFIVTGGSWCCNHIWPNGGILPSLYVIKFDSLGLLYPIGINEHAPTENALLSFPYPNPASTQTTFTVLVPPTNSNGIAGEKGAAILLFDMRGAQLQKHALQTGLNTLTLDVSSLASGEYLCVLSLDGYNAGGKKIIVQR
ncbi:MAG TPA: T9SS type A sorting domain-containing protein [Bacteroidia bacterium]|nr:T9SS type A sorting domain-containing protein [Bacteroidia bacterium]